MDSNFIHDERNSLRDGRQKNWFYLENDLIDREDLDVYEKIVYAVIARFADRQDTAFPGYNTIAKKAGISKRTAINTVKKLHLKGLIVKHQRKTSNNGNQSNLYLLLSAGTNNPYEGTSLKQSGTEGGQLMSSACGAPPGAQDTPPSACDAPPSAQDTPPLVHEVHHPSAQGAPEQDLYNNTYFNNNNIKKEPVVVESKNNSAGSSIVSSEQEVNQVEAEVECLLKNIECLNHKYTIKDISTIKTIITTYTSETEGFQKEKLLNALDHIKNTEPQEGYRNIAGAIIKARDYSIPKHSIKKTKASKKWETRFHLSQSRFEKYSGEELEETVLNKNPTEAVSKEKEKEILDNLKNL